MAHVNETAVFRLGVLGAMATDAFAARLAGLGLKPKHVGLLTVVDSRSAQDRPEISQLEIARVMGVAPSLVVALADHLEGMGAIDRVRDPEDRRRQLLRLTGAGRELYARCGALAAEVDAEFLTGLADADAARLGALLARLGAAKGLPGSAPETPNGAAAPRAARTRRRSDEPPRA